MIKAALGIFLSAFFIYIATRGVDWNHFFHVTANANYLLLLPLYLAIALFFWIKVERWGMLLQPIKLFKSQELFSPMIIGVTLNYLAFAYIGEGARTYLLAREHDISKKSVLWSIIVERAFDLFAVLFLLGFAVQDYINIDWRVIAAAGVIIAITIARSYYSFRTILELITSSIAMWLTMAFCNHLAMTALGIQVPFSVTFPTIALIILGVSLPNSPGHVGVIELCYVLTLKAYGIPADQAFAAGLFFHVILYSAVISVGCYQMKYNESYCFSRS